MTRDEALAETRRRWPDSSLHNAYETIEKLIVAQPKRSNHSVLQYHVVAYNPSRGGSGNTYKAAFEDAARGKES